MKNEEEIKIKEEEEIKRKNILEKEKSINKELKKEEKEREKPNNIKNEKENIQNYIIGAIKNQLLFDNNIQKIIENQDSNFLINCSVINKEWYDKFLQFSNYELLKQKISQNPSIADEIIKNAINEKEMNIDEINNLIKEKPLSTINLQALEKIENLTFVDDDFAAKIFSLGEKNNKNNINSNINTSNNNIINNIEINNNNNKIYNEPQKVNIILDKGTALIQLNEQKFICANISKNNLKNLENVQIYNFPEKQKINLFQEIKKNSKVVLKQIIQNEYLHFYRKNSKRSK